MSSIDGGSTKPPSPQGNLCHRTSGWHSMRTTRPSIGPARARAIARSIDRACSTAASCSPTAPCSLVSSGAGRGRGVGWTGCFRSSYRSNQSKLHYSHGSGSAAWKAFYKRPGLLSFHDCLQGQPCGSERIPLLSGRWNLGGSLGPSSTLSSTYLRTNMCTENHPVEDHDILYKPTGFESPF